MKRLLLPLLLLPFLLPLSAHAGGFIAVRQHVLKVQSASGTTCPITITSSLAGSVLTISGYSRGSRTITGVTDNQGDTWTQATGAAASGSGGANTADSWYALTPAAGVTLITVQYSGSAGTDKRTCEAWEVAGLSNPSFDTAGNVATTGSGTIDTGPSLTMTGTDGFSWGGTNSSGSTSAFPATGNEYRSGGDLSGDFIGGFASLVYSSSGTHQPVATDGGSGSQFVMTAAAIKGTRSTSATTQIIFGRSDGATNGDTGGTQRLAWYATSIIANGAVSNASAIPNSGVLSNFTVYADHPMTGTQQLIVTVQRNNTTVTNLTCTISSSSPTNANGDAYCSDNSDAVVLERGDNFNVFISNANTPPKGIVWYTIEFTPTTSGMNAYTTREVNNLGTSGQTFFRPLPLLSPNATEPNMQAIRADDGTVSNLWMQTGSNLTSGNYTFTLRVNSATSSPTLSCAIQSGTNPCSDTTHSTSLALGDLFNFNSQNNAPSANQTVSGGFSITPTTSGHFEVFSVLNGADSSTLNKFLFLNAITTSNEASTSVYTEAASVNKIAAYVTTAPGVGKTRTFYLRQNGVTTSCSVAITDTNISNTAACSVNLATGDKIDILDEPTTGSPAATSFGAVTLQMATGTPPTPPPSGNPLGALLLWLFGWFR